jgi:hypothetical protein
MTRRSPSWLTGALILTNDSEKKLTLELLLPLPGKSMVSVRFLDRYRFELCENNYAARCRIERTMSAVGATDNSCELILRAQKVLGIDMLHRSACEIHLPDSILQQSSYIGFSIRPSNVPPTDPADATEPIQESAQDRCYLEIHRSKLATGTDGVRSLFFLMTHQQRNDRFLSIAETCDLLTRTDEATTEAMEMVMFTLLSGIDCPLVTEPLEDESDE